MNLGQIELAIYDRLNFPSTPDSAVIRRIRQFVNDAHREVLSKKGYSQLRRATLTATCVANQPLMVLPQAATLILVIADRTNVRNLEPISLQDLRFRDPSLTFSSVIPDSYVVINFASSVARDPSAAASLFVISDAAADGSGLSATVEGTVTGGYMRSAAVALNGLTGVNLDSTISTWEHVTKFYVSGAAAGNITLREGSGVGTELSRIVKGRSYPRYTLIHLSGTPGSVYTYYCDVELHVSDMNNFNDEPLLPEDFHLLLQTGALKREFLRKEKITEYGIEQANWKNGLNDLAAHLRTRGGVSVGGQRQSKGYRAPMYSNPYMNG